MKILFYSFILVLFSVCPILGQNNDCSKVSGGEYKIGYSAKLVNKPKSISLQISIAKKNVNRDFMIALARRLRADFCGYNTISVFIFDNHKLALDPASPFIFLESNRKIVPMRGIYNLNRTTGEEGLEFSKESGKPTNQEIISFKNGDPIH